MVLYYQLPPILSCWRCQPHLFSHSLKKSGMLHFTYYLLLFSNYGSYLVLSNSLFWRLVVDRRLLATHCHWSQRSFFKLLFILKDHWPECVQIYILIILCTLWSKPANDAGVKGMSMLSIDSRPPMLCRSSIILLADHNYDYDGDDDDNHYCDDLMMMTMTWIVTYQVSQAHFEPYFGFDSCVCLGSVVGHAEVSCSWWFDDEWALLKNYEDPGNEGALCVQVQIQIQTQIHGDLKKSITPHKDKYKYLVNCGVLCVQTWGFYWLHGDLKQKYQNLLDHSTIVYNCT